MKTKQTTESTFETIGLNLTDEETIGILEICIPQMVRPCSAHLFDELKTALTSKQKKSLAKWKQLVYTVFFNDMINLALEQQIDRMEQEAAKKPLKKQTKKKVTK